MISPAAFAVAVLCAAIFPQAAAGAGCTINAQIQCSSKFDTDKSFVKGFGSDVQARLPNITSLDLVGCGFSSRVHCLADTEQCQAMEVDVLDEATRLQRLSLSSNALESLPANVLRSNLQLQSLCLDDNQLVEIGDALASLAQLETLKLEKNRLTTVRASSFTACASLTLVRLSNNSIATIEQGAFASATEMDKLFLRNNEIATFHSGTFTGLESLRLLDLAHW